MSRYEFLNVNPLGIREEDCVCRAIKTALNEDYYTIKNKLELVGELFECEALCVCCYKFLLDNVYDLKRVEEVEGMTVGEFAELFPKGTYIVRVDGHLTTVIDGKCYDIWDCTEEIVHLVWIVE